ncbi:MAG TPA: tetratricopeptide repeat protein [Bryobacterales bacterium]|nr:tetratricopeptide repeat protein [Bryobacterales bacterium]
MRALVVVLALALGAPAGAGASSEPDYRASGGNHFFNLEYDEAIADYKKLIEQNPADPAAYNSLASAELYKELYRLGMLESSALRGDNQFLRRERPQPDPQAKARFEEALDHGRRAAESLLARDRSNQLALYALGASYALRGNYEFMIEKAWFSALRSGAKARDYCERLRKLNPNFTDAYLVLGVYEYVIGNLPAPVKVLAAIGGMRGSKKKGEEYITRVAREGRYSRNDARVLLVILYRREHRPLEAANLLESLIADFPRNYVLGLELASMYADAGQNDRAIAAFKSLLQKAKEGAPGYQRLPREAVLRRVEKLEKGM